MMRNQLEVVTTRFLSPRSAWITAGLGILLTLTALGMGYSLNLYGYAGEIHTWYAPLFEVFPILVAFFIGGLIASRLRSNLYGWLWLLIGWGAGVLQPWGVLAAVWALSVAPPKMFFAGIAVYVTGIAWLISIPMIPFTLLYFPDGKLPSRGWRWLPRIAMIALAVAIALIWAIPGESGTAPVDNPFGLPGVLGQVISGVLIAAIGILLFLVFPLSLLSLIFRYLRANSLVRTQIRWLLVAGAANVLIFILDGSEIHQPWVSEDTMTQISNLVLIGLPVSVAVAILRYRLYDIDIIIRRTLQYSLLTGLLVLTYFGGIVVLQSLLSPLTGSENSPLVTVITTLGIAALFNPLRTRVQDFIDRRFYRKKYDAEQALTQFAASARDEVDMGKLMVALSLVIQETVQPEKVSLWIKEPKNRKPR